MKAIFAFESQLLTFGKFHSYFMANNLRPVAVINPLMAARTGSETSINTKKTTTPMKLADA